MPTLKWAQCDEHGKHGNLDYAFAGFWRRDTSFWKYMRHNFVQYPRIQKEQPGKVWQMDEMMIPNNSVFGDMDFCSMLELGGKMITYWSITSMIFPKILTWKIDWRSHTVLHLYVWLDCWSQMLLKKGIVRKNIKMEKNSDGNESEVDMWKTFSQSANMENEELVKILWKCWKSKVPF